MLLYLYKDPIIWQLNYGLLNSSYLIAKEEKPVINYRLFLLITKSNYYNI